MVKSQKRRIIGGEKWRNTGITGILLILLDEGVCQLIPAAYPESDVLKAIVEKRRSVFPLAKMPPASHPVASFEVVVIFLRRKCPRLSYEDKIVSFCSEHMDADFYHRYFLCVYPWLT